MIYRITPTPTRRRGVILIVVLMLLTVFAIVGLTFYLYSRAQSESARAWRESSVDRRNTEGASVINFGLGRFIFGDADDEAGVGSAMRGHDLAHSTWGFNDMTLNTQPWSGNGRWHYTYPNNSPYAALQNQDDFGLVNYMYFSTDGFYRDPERYGTDGPGGSVRPTPTTRQKYTSGFNVSYTYPDHNNMFVAAVKSDGTVMTPSFHRPWLFNPNPANPNWNNLNDTTNPNWTNLAGKYKILRPRPYDMKLNPNDPAEVPQFPYPADAGGDVKNKDGAPGGYDSIWMDLGYPPTPNPADGRYYKPLFAFLVEPLDNRIDLNVHGNLMANGTHTSYQGWGKWEINPAHVLDQGNGAEWYKLLRSRYGSDQQPSKLNAPPPSGSRTARVFSQLDINGFDETTGTQSNRYSLPGEGSNTGTAFPQFGSSYDNSSYDSNTVKGELLNHASLADRFKPSGETAGADDNSFNSMLDMRRLLMNSDVALTRFYNLCPANFPATTPTPPDTAYKAMRRRNMVNVLNVDFNRVAMPPWLYDRNASGYAIQPTGLPSGSPVAVPSVGLRNTTPAPQYSDFSPTDWRYGVFPPSMYDKNQYDPAHLFDSNRTSLQTALEKLDLNRYLTPYPHRKVSGNLVTMDLKYSFDTAPMQEQQQAAQALADRQQLATEIYNRLKWVTGAVEPVDLTTPTDTELEPLRWLAQLAVNIVDYIDDDEISTPFNFYPLGNNETDTNSTLMPKEPLPKGWVFGTELPTVVLNEVLVEYQLPPTDPITMKPKPTMYDLRVFAELHNPLPNTGQKNSIQQQDTTTGVPLKAYKIVVSGPNQLYKQTPPKANVVGSVDTQRAFADFSVAPNQTQTVHDATAKVNMEVAPQKYFLVGPSDDDYSGMLKKRAPTTPDDPPIYVTTDMQKTVMYPDVGMDDPDDVPKKAKWTVALRRLANPHMKEQPDPTIPSTYNPYITVDYIDQVPLNEYKKNGPQYASWGKKQPYAAYYNAQDPKVSQLVLQTFTGTGMGTDQLLHTFGSKNTTDAANDPPQQFTWLQHLDRILLSPLELLNVSRCPPHELTHAFATLDTNGKTAFQKHRAPWLDEDLGANSGSHRLWRFFEMVETSNHGAGISRMGRDPGRININMVWDWEILLALCDPNATANSYNVKYIFDPTYSPPGGLWDPAVVLSDPAAPLYFKLIASRSPGMMMVNGAPAPVGLGMPPNIPNAFPRGNDVPFTSLGVGDSLNAQPAPTDGPAPTSIDNTLLRSLPPDPNNNYKGRLFEISPQYFQSNTLTSHPDRQFELYNKIFNHVTTRSNVFAVYLTVGYFEVTNLNSRPVKLGKEVTTNGVTVRQRFFCIVDRTQMVMDLKKADGTSDVNSTGAVTQFYPNTIDPTINVPVPLPVTVSISAAVDPSDNQSKSLVGYYKYESVFPGVGPWQQWQIKAGTLLLVDDGQNQETVQVLSADPSAGSFTAIFKRAHAAGFRIRMYGNPGTQPNFNPSDPKYSAIIPPDSNYQW